MRKNSSMIIMIVGTDGSACVTPEGFTLGGLILNRQRKDTLRGEQKNTWKANSAKINKISGKANKIFQR